MKKYGPQDKFTQTRLNHAQIIVNVPHDKFMFMGRVILFEQLLIQLMKYGYG